jgi:hypothetical protein
MRYDNYNIFLSSQISFPKVKKMLGDESHKRLISHFGENPAVFEAEVDINKEAYDMAMNSFVVCKHADSCDVIVYTCDRVQPYRKGNYFTRNDRSYLAYTGVVSIEDYDLTKMKTLKDVISNEQSIV